MIEPAAGVDRAMLAFMFDAYDEEEVEGREAHRASPAPEAGAGQGGRAPAGEEGGMPERAREIYEELRARVPAEYDEGGRSASATGARTRSAPRCASPSTARRSRTAP